MPFHVQCRFKLSPPQNRNEPIKRVVHLLLQTCLIYSRHEGACSRFMSLFFPPIVCPDLKEQWKTCHMFTDIFKKRCLKGTLLKMESLPFWGWRRKWTKTNKTSIRILPSSCIFKTSKTVRTRYKKIPSSHYWGTRLCWVIVMPSKEVQQLWRKYLNDFKYFIF